MATTAADLAAATLRNGSVHARAEMLAKLVEQVWLGEQQIEVGISLQGLRDQLELTDRASSDRNPMTISIDAVRVRRGHQLRLIVPGPQVASTRPTQRDEKLIALITDAQQTRQLMLDHPEQSLARIASDNNRCRTRLGKLVALACISPDIVTTIVEGRQPEQLTATRLLSMTLPLSWAEQRRTLGIS